MADGLEGVVVAETVLSMVDGMAGRLVICGHDVDDFVAATDYAAVLSLLWTGFLPGAGHASDLSAALGCARVEAYTRLAPALPGLANLAPMDALRAGIARLSDGDGLDTALLLTGAMAVLTPAISRQRRGEAPIPPSAQADHAQDMLRMLGGRYDRDAAAALSAYLAVVSDHGLNASTFAARVIASTRSGLTSAVTGAVSALKGPLHGGAPGPVIDMLDDIGSEDNAEAWLEAALDRGDRLMGFGHRIYRVRDPRADALKRVINSRLAQASSERLALAAAVERAALAILRRRKPDRPLDVNVEFYTALLLEALGFDREVFTCVFAAGRVAGWIAHALEQQASGRLIRPESRYVGPEVAVGGDGGG